MAIDTIEATELTETVTTPVPPRFQKGRPGREREEAALLSELRSNMFTTTEESGDTLVAHLNERGGAGGETLPFSGVSVTTAGRTRLYKPTGECRTVPSTNVEDLLRNGGYSWFCPTCGDDCGGAPWGCAKQGSPQYRQCPVCGKKVFEQAATFVPLAEDPNRIRDEDEVAQMSSGSRARLNEHMWIYHPDTAAAQSRPRPAGLR